eukprot:COSAG03_NODE_6766_length_1008_cov_1.691969_1_plen_104_part_10
MTVAVAVTVTDLLLHRVHRLEEFDICLKIAVRQRLPRISQLVCERLHPRLLFDELVQLGGEEIRTHRALVPVAHAVHVHRSAHALRDRAIFVWQPCVPLVVRHR